MKTIVEQIFYLPDTWHDQLLYIDRRHRATYGETRKLMLQVASWLRAEHKVNPGDRVSLCLPVCLVSAQISLGILASGASYLPLQHDGPPERLSAILTSFEPQILITTASAAKRFAMDPTFPGGLRVIVVDTDFLAFLRTLDKVTPLQKPITVNTNDMAAVFFTSGSTGEPKGAAMSYRSMSETAAILKTNAPLVATDRILMMAPLHYASSIGCFFGVFSGCASYLASEEETMFPDVVADILERESITIWEGATTRLRHLVEEGRINGRNFNSMRLVEFFGEPMPVRALRRLMQAFPSAKFRNTYGASEAFWMTSYEIPSNLPSDTEIIPIGKPNDCYELHLCDCNGSDVAVGEVGEICVIGPVALVGYWQRPDLTAAAHLNGISRSYRTGDLARLGEDGNYYFAGRRDHQVKIRGHRFELGEIEAVLKSHGEVREAVAFLASDDINACVLAENRVGLVGDIRAICVRRLPVFARPKSITVMDKFPQLPSGKVDRIKLEKSGTP